MQCAFVLLGGGDSRGRTNGTTQAPPCSSNGDTVPCFTTNYLPATPKATTTGEGSTALGFYNVQQGDVPYFKSLADNYAMSDNFHQSVDGGTGANHIMFGHADMIWFSDANGKAAAPPNNVKVFTKKFDGAPNPDEGVVAQIENPGSGGGDQQLVFRRRLRQQFQCRLPAAICRVAGVRRGSYSDCSDPTQAGVKEIVKYLSSLSRPIDPRCEKGHYYLLNNYNPGYFGNGKNAYIDQNPSNTPFTIPPSSTRSIGDSLNDHHISWKYYGDQWNNYVDDPYQLNYGTQRRQCG